MPEKHTNNSKSDKDKHYLTYNQITKDYDVYILSEEEYDKLPKQDKKEVKYMILIKKSKTNPPEPKGPPAWFEWWVKNEFRPTILGLKQEIAEVKQEVAEVKQEVAKTNARIDNLVKKNNLKE